MSYIGNAPIVSATRTITEITATAGQTVFVANGGYTVGYIDVFVNGAQLQTSDFTATDGSTVTLSSAATVGDDVRLVAWGTFSTGAITPAALSTPNAVYWDANGNIGIGISSPAAKLDVNGNVFVRSSNNLYTNGIYGYDSDVNISTNSSGAQAIKFSTGSTAGTERMRIDSSGNVCIGGTTADQTFNVVGKRSWFASNSSQYSIKLAYNTASSGFWLGSPEANALAFSNDAGTERMRIDSSGNLLVGLAAQVGTQNTPLNLKKGSGVAWQVGPTAVNSAFVVMNSADIGVYIPSGNTSWTGTSDERLKTDLKPIEDAVNKVSTLRAVTGRFKTDDEGTSRSFLIAQDVQKVFPEAVSKQEDEIGTLGVAYTDVIPLLVAAIKELKAELDATKAQLDESNLILTSVKTEVAALKAGA